MVQAGTFFHVYFVTYDLCNTAVSCKRKSLIKSPILVSLLSEEHAILEGVLSCRSGSPESCTGAGLPLEGNSRQRQNENNKKTLPELLSAATQPDLESVLFFKGLAEGICTLQAPGRRASQGCWKNCKDLMCGRRNTMTHKQEATCAGLKWKTKENHGAKTL